MRPELDPVDPDPADPDPDVDAPVRPEPLASGSAPTRVAVGADGLDTDTDGVADSVVVVDGPDLLLHTDFDGDRLADQVLRFGPTTLPGRGVPPTVDGQAEVHWWAPWTWFADP
ncbi:hypothetical protein LWC33_18820 [Pseudonocardia sp. RS11V-5]|uniref:hypothetical protein n=1 Tax=Pseudonocardia terrae TaxID=2905831 RepID=UPI001E3CB356|nr:hypothetical protein [Pseudonocardia terrae]MCE3553500.1 hypothetical protein [Pseudonocardia terrae]